MTNSFKPQFNNIPEVVFHEWESTTDQNDPLPKINEEEAFALACEKLKADARKEGYAEGLKEAEMLINQQKKEFQEYMRCLLQPMHIVDEALTQEILKTIIWLCQTCIGMELSIHPEKLEALLLVIKAELPTVVGKKNLLMHPQDCEWIKAHIDSEEIKDLLVSDANLSRGDFMLQSEQTIVNGYLSTRLSSIFSEFINKEDLVNF